MINLQHITTSVWNVQQAKSGMCKSLANIYKKKTWNYCSCNDERKEKFLDLGRDLRESREAVKKTPETNHEIDRLVVGAEIIAIFNESEMHKECAIEKFTAHVVKHETKTINVFAKKIFVLHIWWWWWLFIQLKSNRSLTLGIAANHHQSANIFYSITLHSRKKMWIIRRTIKIVKNHIYPTGRRLILFISRATLWSDLEKKTHRKKSFLESRTLDYKIIMYEARGICCIFTTQQGRQQHTTKESFIQTNWSRSWINQILNSFDEIGLKETRGKF